MGAETLRCHTIILIWAKSGRSVRVKVISTAIILLHIIIPWIWPWHILVAIDCFDKISNKDECLVVAWYGTCCVCRIDKKRDFGIFASHSREIPNTSCLLIIIIIQRLPSKFRRIIIDHSSAISHLCRGLLTHLPTVVYPFIHSFIH